MNGKIKNRLSIVLSIIGTLLVLVAYGLVSANRVTGDDSLYQLMNLVGVILIGQEMLRKRAWGGLTLQVAWGIISIIALIAIVS